MLAMVARSVTPSDAAPSPKNSTNLPTTFALRSISVMVRTAAHAVAGELDVHVELQRVGHAGEVDLHRVVDHQLDRHQRLDQLFLLAGALDRGAHRGEVDDQRHPGEVLQEHAGDDEGDLLDAL